mgnify:FL=1
MKKIILCLVAIAVSFATYAMVITNDSHSSIVSANIEALSGGLTLDTNYIQHEGTCPIKVEGDMIIKFINAGLTLKGDGTITLDGKVTCEGGGNHTCFPKSCDDLYKSFL